MFLDGADIICRGEGDSMEKSLIRIAIVGVARTSGRIRHLGRYLPKDRRNVCRGIEGTESVGADAETQDWPIRTEQSVLT